MRVTVYLGASLGKDDSFKEATLELGQWLVDSGYDLVYGGSKVGLMGILADTVLAGGRQVFGYIPTFLRDREIAHAGLTDLTVVETMSERKQLMIEKGDILLALPGGPGTLEEISEAISLARVGQHDKPCILLNINGYYNPLKAQFEAMVASGFLDAKVAQKTLFADNLDQIERFLASQGYK
ncbi:LOG family protein [Streptococcus loxodontisalivarius]|nr:TIGR00730 family Rossman fold protein [Streptococcus loxodontisalivarius]